MNEPQNPPAVEQDTVRKKSLEEKESQPAKDATRPMESTMQQPTTIETWMPEARQLAAQCWCDDETKHIEMDVVLAEAVARRIAAWMDSAAMFNRNSDFYRGIVVEIGEMFGEAAKTSVLALRVPELVREHLKNGLSENGSESDGATRALSPKDPRDVTGEIIEIDPEGKVSSPSSAAAVIEEEKEAEKVAKEFLCECEVCSHSAAICPATASSLILEVAHLRLVNAYLERVKKKVEKELGK